ncbi:hypothetical protein ZWY2020_005797, partial [Hordeum vulgare]
ARGGAARAVDASARDGGAAARPEARRLGPPPVVALDVAWNVAFAAAAAAVLAASTAESPGKPLRLWLVGYALQCVVRLPRLLRLTPPPAAPREAPTSSQSTPWCHSCNWIIGFYWVVTGDVLEQGAPRLYWLTVVFLAFDVFFAVFCVVVACFIGVALCCCLPCVVAILYALVGQEGASDADIGVLPRYKYSDPSENGEKGTDEGVMIPILNNSGTSTSERILLREDAECCICLSSYEDGVELSALPCNHHFHSMCITKWL